MTGPEVTAAMAAEDVDAALVEKAARAMWNAQTRQPWQQIDDGDEWPSWIDLVTRRRLREKVRHALAVVLPEVQAQAVKRERAKRLHAERSLKEMKRAMRSLAETWDRASEGAAVFADILRREVRDAARRTATTEEPTDV